MSIGMRREASGDRDSLPERARRAVTPVHWSFLLSEVAIVSFLVLIATGVVLAFFYRPSIAPVVYEGSSMLYDGRELPGAFASIVRISSDLPGGLLLRRLHRVASYLFIGAALAHLLRVALTGAFRRPRHTNWLVGVGLLLLAYGMGYTGQNLPFELLAGTSLRIGYSLLQSIPYIGEQLAILVYGGEFPTGAVIQRFWLLHVFLLPLMFVAGLVFHIVLVVRDTHAQLPRRGIDGEATAVGEPWWPDAFARSVTLALLTVGVLSTSAVLVPWSDVELEGPYRVAQAANTLQPDWFMFWPEGAMRITPGIHLDILGTTITNPLVAAVTMPLVVVTVIAAYPFLERRLLHSEGEHHVLQHPLEVPLRLGLVTGLVTFLAVISVSATNDVLAEMSGIPIETVVWGLRITAVLGPPTCGWLAYRYARGQAKRWPIGKDE